MALVVGALAPVAAVADPVQAQLKYVQNFELDSNPLLLPPNGSTRFAQPTGGKTLYGTIAMPELTLSRSTADSTISFDNLFEASRFNLPSYSSLDLHSTLAAKQNWETSYLSVSGKLDSDTTRDSELTNSGLNVAGVRHLGVSLAPEYGYSLSARDQIVIDASVQNATYSNLALFRNYLNYSVTPSFQHTFDQRDIGSFIIQASHYNTTSGPQNSADSIGPALGWQRKLTPLISVNASGGYQLVKTKLAFLGSHTQYQSFYNLSVQGTLTTRDTLNLTSTRNVTPQSSGFLITQTSVALSEIHQFSPWLSHTLKIQYQSSDYSTTIPTYESGYLEASSNLYYNFTQRWSLISTLRYRREQRVDTPVDGTSAAVIISLVFTPRLLNLD